MSPTSQAFSMMSCGQVPSLSYSQALGRISFSAKSCASSRNAFCSSVSVKSTTVSLVSLQFSAGPSWGPRRQIDWSVNPLYPQGTRSVTPQQRGCRPDCRPSAGQDPGHDGDPAGDAQGCDEDEAPPLGQDRGAPRGEGP